VTPAQSPLKGPIFPGLKLNEKPEEDCALEEVAITEVFPKVQAQDPTALSMQGSY
jgi:hypothetical protein